MPTPRQYLCHRAPGHLDVTGSLDKPFWAIAPWTDDFVDIEGDTKPPPRFRTRVKMLWDDAYLYIGAEMEEPHVWGTLTEHDSVIFQDNDFEIFIDPDGDHHNYYELEINALNTTWDLRLVKPYRDGGPALNSWEIPGLRNAVSIDGTLNDPSDTDRGWSLEIAIPWAPLAEFSRSPAPPVDGDLWRVNFSRVEWDIDIVEGAYCKRPDRPEHNWVWSPQGAIDMHRPEKWGIVQFSSESPDFAELRADPSQTPRNRLMEVYWLQRAFRDSHGRYAESVSELVGADADIVLMLTREGYVAEVEVQRSGRWSIRHDSLFRHEALR